MLTERKKRRHVLVGILCIFEEKNAHKFHISKKKKNKYERKKSSFEKAKFDIWKKKLLIRRVSCHQITRKNNCFFVKVNPFCPFGSLSEKEKKKEFFLLVDYLKRKNIPFGLSEGKGNIVSFIK